MAGINPTLYLSLNGDYGRAVGDTNGYYQIPEVTVTGYQSKFRVFIPPGTSYIYLAIYEYGGQTAIARQRILPTTFSIPQDYFAPQSRTLDQLLDSDQIISENNEGKLTVINQVLPEGTYVSVDQAGWLYVYVTGGEYSSVYYNKLQIGVNAAVYNQWHDTINWDVDVESVIEYLMGGTGGLDSNPTEYISITKFYPRAPSNVTYYSFGNSTDTVQGYRPQFRCFVPPGTVLMDLTIKEDGGSGKRKSVARHILLPSASPEGDAPSDVIIGDASTLTELIDHDCWSIVNQTLALNVVSDSFSPVLDIDRAGWLYVKVGIGVETYYNTGFSARVETVVYNAWWDTYIKDEAGWNKFIENVETYIPPVPGISVGPAQITANKYAGTATLEVSNPESTIASVAWTAEVSKGSTWLSITSGESGTDAGVINAAFDENTGSAVRKGTIRVTSPKKTIEVSVIQSSTETKPDPPIEITPAKKVVNAMALRLGSVSQAKKGIMQMITDIVDVKTAVNSLTSNALISGNPVAKTIDHFMRNKVAGSFGSYGIESQMTKLIDMKNAMEKEMDFCKTAISMYNQIDMGVTNLVGLDDLSIIPGFDAETFPEGFPLPAGVPAIEYSPDMDNPMSKHMLKLSSDLRMMNRPDDSTNPSSIIGDMICIKGIVHVYSDDGDGSRYYPVGIQEPVDVCKNYPLSHVSTETFKSLCDETIDPPA
jgi:hypothetical protein